MNTTPTERDELAEAIANFRDDWFSVDRKPPAAIDRDEAEHLHELGYRRPRTITTVTELDVLAVGSVVLCRGRAWTRFTPKNIRGGIVQIHKWMCADGGIVRADSDQSILLPATPLHDGGAA